LDVLKRIVSGFDSNISLISKPVQRTYKKF